MKKQVNQAGFELVGVVVVVLILAVIGFAGFQIWQRNQKSNNNQASTATTATTASKVPNTIQSKADLDAASQALDTAGTQVNSQVNGNDLNGDINDLL